MQEENPPSQRSFGVRSFNRKINVTWKTGASSGLKDAWAVGLAGDLLVGVWVGNFDGTANRQLVGQELQHRLFWFVDDVYVGEGQAVFWPGKPGKFMVRVIDDQGQSAVTALTAVPVE